MFTAAAILEQFTAMGVTHVAYLPDSTIGAWERELAAAPGLELVRVCREGEAWAVAAGLWMGGARPVVLIQCTGLFESGDALRNFIYDYGLPLFAVIGYRSYLLPEATDSARTYTEPVLKAFDLPYRLIERAEQLPEMSAFYHECRQADRAGVVLIAEGRM